MVASLGFLLLLCLIAAFADWVAPVDPDSINPSMRLLPPIWEKGSQAPYYLGTDGLGRDILSRMIFGARLSLFIGIVVILIGGGVGVALGIASGYFGGLLDDGIQRLVDLWLALPNLMLAIALVAALGGAGVVNVLIALSLTSWVTFARFVRGEVLSLRKREYVASARVVGASPMRIMATHILPNVLPQIIVLSTFEMAKIILAEASLSFLGIGVGVGAATWGSMLSEGRAYMFNAWWVAALPGIALSLTILAINILGDGLRDVLDPRTTDRR